MTEFNPMDVRTPATSDEEERPNNAIGDDLLRYVERVERLLEQKAEIADDIKDVKAEAKSRGYDMPTFNEMLKLRKMDKGEREERENLRDAYGHALGIFG